MRVVILGDGGHAKVLASLFNKAEMIGKGDPVPDDAELVIGVGDIAKRKALYDEYEPRVRDAISNLAWVAPDVLRTDDVQIMASVIIQPGCSIGHNVLINTGAQIDHDCIIGDHCHIAPGAILCGNVTIGSDSFVGAGAVIVEGVTLPKGSFVPACTLVVGSDDFRKPCKSA